VRLRPRKAPRKGGVAPDSSCAPQPKRQEKTAFPASGEISRSSARARQRSTARKPRPRRTRLCRGRGGQDTCHLQDAAQSVRPTRTSRTFDTSKAEKPPPGCGRGTDL
jgi:hypothetical protein